MLKLISIVFLASLTVAIPGTTPPNLDSGCDGAPAGQVRCYGASQFYVCSGGAPGVHAILQSVAAGTECADGKIVVAGAPPPVASPGKPADPTPPLRSVNEQQDQIEKNLADLKASLKEKKLCKGTPYDSMKATCLCIDKAGPELLRNENMCNDAKPVDTKPPPPPPKPVDPEQKKRDDEKRLKDALKKPKLCHACGPKSQCKATCECIDKASFDALIKDQKLCDKSPMQKSPAPGAPNVDSTPFDQKPSAPKLRRDIATDPNPPPPRPTKWDPAALVNPELVRQTKLAQLRTALKKSKGCRWCGPDAYTQCRATCDCIDKAGSELLKDLKMCDKAPIPPRPQPFIDSTTSSPKPPPDTKPNDPKLLEVKKRLLEKGNCKQCTDRACRTRCNCIAAAGPELITTETSCDKVGL